MLGANTKALFTAFDAYSNDGHEKDYRTFAGTMAKKLGLINDSLLGSQDLAYFLGCTANHFPDSVKSNLPEIVSVVLENFDESYRNETISWMNKYRPAIDSDGVCPTIDGIRYLNRR